MKNLKRTSSQFVVLVILLGLLLFATGSVAFSQDDLTGRDPNTVVTSGPLETKLWTGEELLSAKPMPLLELGGEPEQPRAAEREAPPEAEEPLGPVEIIPGGWPKGESPLSDETEADSEAREAFDLGAATPLGYKTYPPPFTRYRVNYHTEMWKHYPWMTMGVLFFTIPGKGGYRCSGAVAVGRAVWTAGHCVYSPGIGWHTNFQFVPAYRAGSAPYGQYTTFAAATLTGWQNGKHAYDIGMVAVNDKGGQKIGDRLGWLGAKWGASATQHFHAFGFPSASPFDGKYLIVCAASTAKRDKIAGPNPIGIGCDQTGGCSGGPWVVTYKPYESGSNNYVNGVFSYYYTAKPKRIYSPYFGTGAKNLYYWGKSK